MRDPLARHSALFGWCFSIAIHVAIVLLATLVLVPPDTGFEFEAPIEVELGLVEATEVQVAPAAAPEVETAPETAPSGPGEGQASAPDAGPRRARRDAGVDAGAVSPGLGEGAVAFLPAGAQVALRIDMDRVRASPVGEDIAALLRVMPDWRALLGGSDVDPVRDLARILIATPNLQRANVVIAGRVSDDAPVARTIAERLASAQGTAVEWRDEGGVPRATMPSPDATVRDVALLGDRHFVIARPEDLPRVLAIAAARRGRRDDQDPAEALLSMEAGEGLSIEVENVAVFVRRNPCGVVPLRARGALREGEGDVEVRLRAQFESAADAEQASECLERLTRDLSRNVLVSIYGLAGPLERLDFTVEGELLRIETRMRYAEVRTILGLVRGFFASPGTTPPGTTPPGAAPPAPPATAPSTPLPPAVPPPSPFD